jgi:hypothetical protein
MLAAAMLFGFALSSRVDVTAYNRNDSIYWKTKKSCTGHTLLQDRFGNAFGVYDSDGTIGGPSWKQGTGGWYKGGK